MTDITNIEAMGNKSRDALRQFVAAIERLEEEKSEVATQVKDKYAEAKAVGFDTKAMRKLIQRRRMDKQERDELDAILETYEAALYEGAEGLV